MDLSHLAEPEPLEFEYLDKKYVVDLGMLGPATHERIVAWCNNLVEMEDEAANKRSAELIAEALHIEPDEAAWISPPARKRMLAFLAKDPARKAVMPR